MARLESEYDRADRLELREDQKHDNPYLCDIGSGTMVSDGFMMVNTMMSSSSFKLGMVKIGDHNYRQLHPLSRRRKTG
jgi:hypothetical protein